jgi:hypothetical protein
LSSHGNSKKIVLSIVSFLALTLVAYVLLIAVPYPFFKNKVSNRNVHIYYGELPRDEVMKLAEDVVTIIRKSDLYDETDSYEIFIASSAFQYGFYTSIFYKSAGFYNAIGNTFIRPLSIRTNRLIKYDGSLADKSLTLQYVLAHETTHAMTAARLGMIRYLLIPEWLREGIAESASRAISFEELLRYKKTNDPQLNARGKYLLYALRVHYLRNVEQLDSKAILNNSYSEEDLDQRIDRYISSTNPQ